MKTLKQISFLFLLLIYGLVSSASSQELPEQLSDEEILKTLDKMEAQLEIPFEDSSIEERTFEESSFGQDIVDEMAEFDSFEELDIDELNIDAITSSMPHEEIDTILTNGAENNLSKSSKFPQSDIPETNQSSDQSFIQSSIQSDSEVLQSIELEIDSPQNPQMPIDSILNSKGVGIEGEEEVIINSLDNSDLMDYDTKGDIWIDDLIDQGIEFELYEN